MVDWGFSPYFFSGFNIHSLGFVSSYTQRRDSLLNSRRPCETISIVVISRIYLFNKKIKRKNEYPRVRFALIGILLFLFVKTTQPSTKLVGLTRRDTQNSFCLIHRSFKFIKGGELLHK